MGRHLINLSLLNDQLNIDKSMIIKEVAQNLDLYIKNYGEELIKLNIHLLYNIFNHKNRSLTEHNSSYELIIDHFNKTNDFSIFILLPSIDGSKLTDKNRQESIDLQSFHCGFVPSFSLSVINDNDKKMPNLKEIILELLKN